MGHCGGDNDESPEEREAREQRQMLSCSIPGVRCGRCLGRIDAFAFESKRRVSEKLYPGRPVEPPRVCSECLWRMLLLTIASDDEDESATKTVSE